MRMAKGEVWRRVSAERGCGIYVIIDTRGAGPRNPACACGTAPKNRYLKPAQKIGVRESGRMKESYALELS